MDFKTLLLQQLFPAFGTIVGIIMYCSVLPDLRRCLAAGTLGDFNPIPLPTTFLSAGLWAGYSFISSNPWIFPANTFGTVFSLCTSTLAYGVAGPKAQKQILGILASSTALVLGMAALVAFVIPNKNSSLQMWGIIANLVTFAYYAAPASTILVVFRERSSATICLANNVMNASNAFLWFTYGLAIGDLYVWLPNTPGLLFAPLMIALCFVFPKPKTVAAAAAGGGHATATPGQRGAVVPTGGATADAAVCAACGAVLPVGGAPGGQCTACRDIEKQALVVGRLASDAAMLAGGRGSGSDDANARVGVDLERPATPSKVAVSL